MELLSLLKMGTPSLQEKSKDVTHFDLDVLPAFISDLIKIKIETNAVGIAAPQVGINQRIIVVGFEHSSRYPNEKPVPLSVMINPEYQPLSDEKVDGWEGCLSIPGLRGKVPRYKKIRYSALNEEGKRIEGVAEDFHARIIQHECDHLDGILFIERVVDFKFFGFNEIMMERIKLENQVSKS